MKNRIRSLTTLAAFMTGFCLMGGIARADNTPGVALTLTSGATGTYTATDLFSISGNTITVNGDPTGNHFWNLSGGASGQLIGISKIFLVKLGTDSHGNVTTNPGPDTVTNGGFVKINANASSRAWFQDVQRGYDRYVDVDPTKSQSGGYGDGDPWMVVGDPSLVNKQSQFQTIAPNSKGKGGHVASPEYTFGSFTFDGSFDNNSLLDAQGNLKYAIGIDYLIQSATSVNGATGRGYINSFPGSGHSVEGGPDSSPIPEPAFYQMSALLVLGGLGALRLRKKNHQAG